MAHPEERTPESTAEIGIIESMRAEQRAVVRRVAVAAVAQAEAEGVNIPKLPDFLARVCGAEPTEVLRTLGQISNSGGGEEKELKWNYGYSVNRDHPEVPLLADAMQIEGPRGVVITRDELRERVRGHLVVHAALDEEYRLQASLFEQPRPEAPPAVQ